MAYWGKIVFPSWTLSLWAYIYSPLPFFTFFPEEGLLSVNQLSYCKRVGKGDCRLLLQHFSTHWCWQSCILHSTCPAGTCCSLSPVSVSAEELSAVVPCCWDGSRFLFRGELWVLTDVQQEIPLNIGTRRLPGSLGGKFLSLEAAALAEGL